MNKEDLIRMFYAKRVSPFDGMAVTATVWEKAHGYHRHQQQLHALFSHGAGIVTGLEIIASDPPDSTVYILPGVAVDPLGQVVALTEPTAYDVGEADGQFRLMLNYGESRPKPDHDLGDEGGPLYVHPEFGVELGREGLSDVGAVELATIRRRDKTAPIINAKDSEHPGLNEIDMRFRQEVGAASRETATLAVCYAGREKLIRHGNGVSYLARALRRSGDFRAWVDWDVPLTADLTDYTLVYLVGREAFELPPDETQALYNYVGAGGTLLIEGCRRGVAEGDPPADASFGELLGSLGFSINAMQPDHNLLLEPFLFAGAPPGFDSGSVQVGDGVIWSTCDYGCLWQGERRDGVPSREEIRSAMEWGANITAYALARRKRIKGE